MLKAIWLHNLFFQLISILINLTLVSEKLFPPIFTIPGQKKLKLILLN